MILRSHQNMKRLSVERIYYRETNCKYISWLSSLMNVGKEWEISDISFRSHSQTSATEREKKEKNIARFPVRLQSSKWCDGCALLMCARLQNGCKCSATPVAPHVLGQREMFSGRLKTMQIRPKKHRRCRMATKHLKFYQHVFSGTWWI